MADNKVIAIKKENQVKKWIKDHEGQLILAGGAITFGLLCAAIFKCGIVIGEGPRIDEWVPAPVRDTDGNIGVSMLGLKNYSDGGSVIVEHKDFFYEKPEYAGNFAKTITKWVEEANSTQS